ncbi:MAG TPA: phenylalanine--tRNA ligase subunit beta [Bacteroidia bacterium]|nr:phenylalanine--tRNA ligase subunit beta [Bacteroidia bacterium]
MRISFNWLKEYQNFNTSPVETASLLTSCGLEVESVEEYYSVPGGMKGLVIGHVLTCEKHPSVDRLSLTTVDIGNEEIKKIVCGAPNIKAGQKVVVAPVGTTVYPVSGTPFEIRNAKIRGENSEGMICAEDEIGLGISHEGVLILKDDARIGSLASDYFNVTSDYVFEIGLTPNRVDAASHYGVARDLNAVLDLIPSPSPKEKEALRLVSLEKFSIDNTNLPIAIEVKDVVVCPRYCGITVSGVVVAPSPKWLQQRLISIGMHPAYNIVDITNFVLHECGQPLHAFDADKISGKKIILQKLKEGTPFTTLDGKERKLSADDLMICDAEKPMCIAGVFGGINSGITEATKNIFIESAFFSPETIRKTVRYHGLHTDASFRFERGADVSMALYALKRAAVLIREIAGGKISSDVTDVYPSPVQKRNISLDWNYLNTLCGFEVDRKTAENILSSLGFEIKSSNSSLSVDVPHHKTDVVYSADLVEEILRIYGYNKIPMSKKISISFSDEKANNTDRQKNNISAYLSSCGFSEIMTNSLTAKQNTEKLSEKKIIPLLNPLSVELDVMRTEMFLTGLESVRYNLNRQQDDLKFFEFGKVYSKENQGNREETRLALYITGNKNPHSWNSAPVSADFFFLKAYVENIFSRIGIQMKDGKLETENVSGNTYSYRTIISLGKNILVSYGLLNRALLRSYDIDALVFHADLNWDSISEMASKHSVSFKELPRFPHVKRDISMIIDKATSYASIHELAYSTEKNLLRDVNLFDLYEGENIPAGKKSCALSFYLRDDAKTLTDSEIDAVVNRFINAFEKKLGAVVRKSV